MPRIEITITDGDDYVQVTKDWNAIKTNDGTAVTGQLSYGFAHELMDNALAGVGFRLEERKKDGQS